MTLKGMEKSVVVGGGKDRNTGREKSGRMMIVERGENRAIDRVILKARSSCFSAD